MQKQEVKGKFGFIIMVIESHEKMKKGFWKNLAGHEAVSDT